MIRSFIKFLSETLTQNTYSAKKKENMQGAHIKIKGIAQIKMRIHGKSIKFAV